MAQPASQPESITLLLRQLEHNGRSDGDSADPNEIAEQLYGRVRAYFRSVATRLQSNQPPHQTPPITQVVDDTFIKLLRQEDVRYNNRKHFLNAAAMAMRQVVVDHFRSLSTDKRRIDQQAIPLSGDVLADLRAGLPSQIVELDDTIRILETKYPQAMEAFVFSRFMRMTYDEIADTMDLTVHQVESLIRLAKAKVLREIRDV
jgi:RNA polymerase sigma factor (TIGR02999 family)